ncbi:MAG TPA: primosomal protein N' [Thermoleophilaceae bacterium]|nr:primosomal protein N' [Thermoleophilaceae bacterium]
MIAKVEPLTSARALRGPFDYALPGELSALGVGSVVMVPFARRQVLGVVVGVAEQSELPPERLATPLRALEADVPPELVRLGLWVGEEYCSTPARGLALVLPPGTGTGAKQRVKPRNALTASITDAGRLALAADAADGPSLASDALGAASKRLGVAQRRVLEALSAAPLAAAAACRSAGCSHDTLKRLAARGLVTLDQVRVRRAPDAAGIGSGREAGASLTAAQEAAVARITAALDGDGGDRCLLLHGVTGSGKTEVYLRAVAEALARGSTAIVLVPEIALTPQTVTRFRQRFGDQVAVLHSSLSLGERYDEWDRLRRGDARVCVGPRSAVFAPLTELGLIVVDEEHDPSYKQDGDPRYDARHVAEKRAEMAGAVLVAGSATPRPETRVRLERIEMPERVDGQSLPPVEIAGMAGVSGALHPRTRDALEQVRERGEKAIILLNRRGWSNFLQCGTCGHVWGCPQCDVTLVLHRAAGRMACHHCGHSEPVPALCAECGSMSLSRHGTGTEKLEDELVNLIAPLPVFRLDSDTAAERSAVTRILGQFEQADSGVLVGTQMVAKGHDFPDVTLGVVLDADSTLRFPDFRSEERTFALVAQLAGRSGRGTRGGRVVVQALDPSARALRLAAAHDSEGFLKGEIARRLALRYPPFGNLIRIVCLSEESGREVEAASALRELIALEDAQILGPAPLFRLQGRERSQLVVKAADRSAAVRSVRHAVEQVAGDRRHKGVALSVDVDPQ